MNAHEPRQTAGRSAQGEGDHARLATRLASDFLLRSLQLVREMPWGDMVTGLVCLAVIQSNIGYIDRADGPGGDYAGTSDPPPDTLRRPVSVLSLSAMLGLPYETTRRHVAKLIASGACERVKGGIIVPARVLDGEMHREQLRRNMANLKRLYRDLKAAGVELD